ncbi:MAG: GGDEF domain-containing protein [Alkalibacterium sp.]|nr:GGDEF domain-containing protein [Alkalibacterium sp.]
MKINSTDASTRKYFIKCFEKERQKLMENRGVFSVAFIDIDDFEEVNETYGHLAGDNILIDFVKIISAHLGEGEDVFRFGGDEFLVLFPEKGEQEAKSVIVEISQDILLKKFGTPDNQSEAAVTFSSGIAAIH